MRKLWRYLEKLKTVLHGAISLLLCQFLSINVKMIVQPLRISYFMPKG